MAVSIKGINKVKLLMAVWEYATPAAFYAIYLRPSPPFDESAAKDATMRYIDYYCGRCIKLDLSGDTTYPIAYDLDRGAGSFQRIVERLSA
jgi:hypothetical protein